MMKVMSPALEILINEGPVSHNLTTLLNETKEDIKRELNRLDCNGLYICKITKDTSFPFIYLECKYQNSKKVFQNDLELLYLAERELINTLNHTNEKLNNNLSKYGVLATRVWGYYENQTTEFEPIQMNFRNCKKTSRRKKRSSKRTSKKQKSKKGKFSKKREIEKI